MAISEMKELIEYLSEKIGIPTTKIAANSSFNDPSGIFSSDDWNNLEVIIEVGENFGRTITDEEAETVETVSDIYDIISN
jgi:acyl carrier protein|tara:strand:- start:214 stop:453 length:240 start_codon:yes stop_codon:yes gene_type:complete